MEINSPFVRDKFLNLWVLDYEIDSSFSTRVFKRLHQIGVRTFRDLVLKTETELLAPKQFGEKSLREVKYVLWDLGLKLGLTEADLSPLLNRHSP